MMPPSKIETHTFLFFVCFFVFFLALPAMFPKEKNTTKNKWLEQGEQSCIIPFEHHVRNVCFGVGISSIYSPLRFHWLRNKRVCTSLCFLTKYRVNENRAGKG